MATEYIPSREQLLAAWSKNFAGQIAATPGAFGLMASDAESIRRAVQLFTDALTIATNPQTRSKPKVADKNAKKWAMVATLRFYAQTIKLNLGISHEAKLGLGLTLNSARSPILAPQTAPVLSINNSGPLRQTVRYADPTAFNRRGKPAGVKGMMLSVSVGDTPPELRASMPSAGMVTRQGYAVDFKLADAGKSAYYYGRWITARGLMGPWSPLAQRTVA